MEQPPISPPLIFASDIALTVGTRLTPGLTSAEGFVFDGLSDAEGTRYEQPVFIVREVTREEWLAHGGDGPGAYFYEIVTD